MSPSSHLRAVVMAALACVALRAAAQVPSPSDSASPAVVFQRGHSEPPCFIAFLDDERFVTCSVDEAYVWSYPEGRLIAAHKGLGSVPVALVTGKGAGELLMSKEGVVLVDLARNGASRRVFSSKLAVLDLAASPDGCRAAAALRDGSLKLHDIRGGKAILDLTGAEAGVFGVAFSTDGAVLAGAGSSKIRFWDASTGAFLAERPISVPDKERVFALSCLPASSKGIAAAGFQWSLTYGGKPVAARTRDGRMEARVGREIDLFRDSGARASASIELSTQDSIEAIAFSPDGSRLLAADRSGRLRYWDLDSFRETILGTRGPGAVTDLQASPDGRWLFVAYDGRGPHGERHAVLWDLRAGKPYRRIVGEEEVAGTWRFLPDGRGYISVEGRCLALREIATGALIREYAVSTKYLRWALQPGGEGFVAATERAVLRFEVGKAAPVEDLTPAIGVPGGRNRDAIAFSPKGDKIVLRAKGGFYEIFSVGDWKRITRIQNDGGDDLVADFSTDGTLLRFRYFSAYPYPVDGTVLSTIIERGSYGAESFFTAGAAREDVYDAVTGKRLAKGATFPGASTRGAALLATGSYGPSTTGQSLWAEGGGGEFLYVGGRDGLVRVIDPKRKAWCGLYLGSPFDAYSAAGAWIGFTGEGYWDGSVAGTSLVTMSDGWRSYGLDQFAARNNRPDLVLEALRSDDAEAIAYYRAAYKKRLTRLGLSEAAMAAAPEPPVARVDEHSESGASCVLLAEFTPATADRPLAGYRVFANGVPLGMGEALELAAAGGSVRIEAPLVEGSNRIEVSCVDASGSESARAGFAVELASRAASRRLFYAGLGVSRYADRRLDLRYAAKDAEDLAAAFKAMGGREGYSEVLARTWLDEDVEPDALAEAASFLAGSRPEDTVVLFIAGHGVHDRGAGAEYYYLSHDANPADLAGTAMTFESIEGLLSGIAARRKLFLMDTCESGEADEPATLPPAATGARIASRGAAILADGSYFDAAGGASGRGLSVVSAAARPWLRERDRYIEMDLRRRTGAVVFSSCRGSELSYESEEAANGFFTEALLAGLGGAADADVDGTMSVDELRAYAAREVARLSGGLQNPVVDRDNAIASGLSRFPLPAALRNATAIEPVDMKRFEAGSFVMSGIKGDKLNPVYERYERKHKVRLTKPFLLATTETTVGDYALVLEWARSKGRVVANPDLRDQPATKYGETRGLLDANGDWKKSIGYEGGRFSAREGMERLPMTFVTWYGAAAYCAWRSEMEGLSPAYDLRDWSVVRGAEGYRLPTDAEWEYAARSGGKAMIFSWGSGKPKDENLFDESRHRLAKRSTYEAYWKGYDDGFPELAPAGSFPAAVSGLRDMSGNVHEWCNDLFSWPADKEETDPPGGSSGTERLVRGGSYDSETDDPINGRLSARYRVASTAATDLIGFRVARSAK